jgi:hypothetical protein
VLLVSDYWITPAVQKPLRHTLVGSQQFAADSHLSPTAEQLFVDCEHTSAPLPLASQ